MIRIAVIIALAFTAMMQVQPQVVNASSPTAETKLLEWVNRARGDDLIFGHWLSKAAEKHSNQMAKTKDLFHNTVRCRRWAQDVGVGPTPWSVFRAFMRSPDHRAALLGPFRRIGIGVVHIGGAFWVTLNFCTRPVYG